MSETTLPSEPRMLEEVSSSSISCRDGAAMREAVRRGADTDCSSDPSCIKSCRTAGSSPRRDNSSTTPLISFFSYKAVGIVGLSNFKVFRLRDWVLSCRPGCKKWLVPAMSEETKGEAHYTSSQTSSSIRYKGSSSSVDESSPARRATASRVDARLRP